MTRAQKITITIDQNCASMKCVKCPKCGGVGLLFKKGDQKTGYSHSLICLRCNPKINSENKNINI